MMETAVETGSETQDMPPEKEDNLDNSIPVDPKMIERLSIGVLEKFLPDLQKGKSQLDEVLHCQEVLIETVQHENEKFVETDTVKELTETMEEAKRYHTKLVGLKKEMQFLRDKSDKLKRQAVKIQHQKQKEEHQQAQQRERELEKERMLEAKVAKRQESLEEKQTPT